MRLKAEIKTLIAKGEFRLAAFKLEEKLDKNIRHKSSDLKPADLPNLFNLIKARFSEIEKQSRQGGYTNAEATIEKNKLNNSFLQLIDRFPDGFWNNHNETEILDLSDGSIVQKKEIQYDFFLCHSSSDLDESREIYNRLKEHQKSVFFAPETLKLKGGLSFFEEIDKAISKCQNFILLSSDESMQSEWVKAEYQTFYNEYHLKEPKKRNFYILIGEHFNPNSIPNLFKRFQYVNNINEIIGLNYENKEIGIQATEESNSLKSKKVNYYVLLVFLLVIISTVTCFYYYNFEQKELKSKKEINAERSIDISQVYPLEEGESLDKEPRFYFTKSNNLRGWSFNKRTASCVFYSESIGSIVLIGQFDGQFFTCTRVIQLSDSDNIAGWNWDGKTASYLAHEGDGTVLVIQDFNGHKLGDQKRLIVSSSYALQGWTWDGKTASYLIYDMRGVVLVIQDFDSYNFGDDTQVIINWPDKNSWLLIDK